MELEKTEGNNPIEFESWVSGPNGARFALYPKQGLHTDDDVKEAKRFLHHNRDVVGLQVRWQRIEDTRPNPEKIPDYLIIKNLQKELGQANSYIEELEETVKKLKTDIETSSHVTLTSQDKHEIKREILYQQQAAEKKALQKKIQELSKDKEDLIIRLHQKQS